MQAKSKKRDVSNYLVSYKSLRRKKIKSLRTQMKASLTKDELKRTRNKSTVLIVTQVVLYTVLTTYAIISFLPFLWAFASSFKPQSEFDSGSIGLFPQKWTPEGYKFLFDPTNGINIRKWLANSVIVCLLGTMLNMVCNTLAGYALARLNFPGRNKIFWLLLATTMVPGQVALIPNYIIVTKLGMIGSFASLIIPGGVSIGNIFMTRQFFINFPREVEEAAEVDGISKIGSFLKIGIPLLMPILATQVVFTFTGFWNSFLTANLYLGGDSEKWTITVGLFAIASGNTMPIYNRILAASVISLIPVLILYIVLNNFFMKSYRMDGEK